LANIKNTEKVTNIKATGTELSVIIDITERQQKGIGKYGTTVSNNPLSLKEWLQHAYEEHLDACIYLKRAIGECDEPQGVLKKGR